MKELVVDISTPHELMALDEYMLRKAETGESAEVLYFWESGEYFVVLGRAGTAEKEADLAACKEDGIPVIRRISGGGTVLQGPGCLNYSIVLSYSRDHRLTAISSSYDAILERICAALDAKGVAVSPKPLSDIMELGRKVSGNAQARKRRYLLHHGTLLYGLDTDKVERYLFHPGKEPAYRKRRKHADFIGNLKLSRDELIDAIKEAFPCDSGKCSLSEHDRGEVTRLVREKYLDEDWNLFF